MKCVFQSFVLTLVLVGVSIAALKHHDQRATWGGKEVRTGAQTGRILKAGAGAETLEGSA